MQNMSLNVGTVKLNVKNLSENWIGLRGKSLRTFYVASFVFVVVVVAVVVIVVVFLFVLCFRFLTFILLSS